VNVPLPLPRRMDTALAWHPAGEQTTSPELVTARSSLPSRLKSPTAMELGKFSTVTVDGAGVKPPWPSFNRIGTDDAPAFATAISILPSPLKSPVASASGISPTVIEGATKKVPSCLPSRIAMFPLVLEKQPVPAPQGSEIARSG